MSYPFFDYFTFTMSISPQNLFTSPGLSFKFTLRGHPSEILTYGAKILVVVSKRTRLNALGETQSSLASMSAPVW